MSDDESGDVYMRGYVDCKNGQPFDNNPFDMLPVTPDAMAKIKEWERGYRDAYRDLYGCEVEEDE
jgi:hypothetical protein